MLCDAVGVKEFALAGFSAPCWGLEQFMFLFRYPGLRPGLTDCGPLGLKQAKTGKMPPPCAGPSLALRACVVRFTHPTHRQDAGATKLSSSTSDRATA